MELKQAIEILTDYVELNRSIRTEGIESDFDKLREEKCIAIETVLNAIVVDRS